MVSSKQVIIDSGLQPLSGDLPNLSGKQKYVELTYQPIISNRSRHFF